MKPRNPEFRAYTQAKIELNQYMKYLGFQITTIEAGLIEGELEFKTHHQQQDGWVHGGVTSALCDIVAGYASYTMLEEGQRVVTAEIKISYYNPGRGDKIYARGRVLKAGRRFIFAESEVYVIEAEEEKTVARATTTMAVLDK